MRKKSILAISVAAVLFLASCGDSGSASTPGDNGPAADSSQAVNSSYPLASDLDPSGTFTWGYSAEVTSFDPHRGSSAFDNIWLSPVFDRLVYSNSDGIIEPMLATEWEISEDGSTLTMQLREGLSFSDGEPFNSEAAKYSLDRAMGDESVVQNELATIQEVRTDGEYTLHIDIDGGAGSLLGTLADRPGMMISPAVDDPNANPVGIGPYVVTENVAGDRVSYEATPNYWAPEVQNVNSMIFRVMGDDQTRMNALQSKEILGGVIRQNQVEALSNMGFNVLAGEGPTFFNLAMNTDLAPFDDEQIRRAIALAIDRVSIGDGLLGGYCTPQAQMWPSNSWAYNQDIGDGLDRVPFDQDEARQLLADSGYEDGLEFDAAVTDITGYISVAEAVQAQLAEIGITMNLHVLPAAQAREMFQVNDEAEAYVTAYSPSPDPHGVLDRLLLPTAAANPGEYTDEKIVELAELAASEIEPDLRAGYYHEISERILDVTPAATPICMQHRTEGFAPEVSGLEIYPGGLRDFRGVGVSG